MELKELVKEKYGEAARRVVAGGANNCCGASAALDSCCDPITSNLYDDTQAGEIPQEALQASLGCGNPTALAALHPGETVLDLGSGGGIASALQDAEYTAKLTQAGFQNVGIEPTRIYDIEDARAFLAGQGLDVDAIAPQVQDKFMSAFIRARKPGRTARP